MVGVLLGLPGPWADDEREPSDHYTTKIGGVPDWPPFPDGELKPELLVCRSCESRLYLISQIYAPISTKSLKIEERTLYIFGCLTPECGTTELSWRAIRVQKANKDEEPEKTLPKEDAEAKPVDGQSPVPVTKTKSWNVLDSSDDDDDDYLDLDSLSKALFEAATVASSSKKKTKKHNSRSGSETKAESSSSPLKSQLRSVDDNTPVVPCFYVDTSEETNSSKHVPPIRVEKNVNAVDDGAGNEEVWDEEKYEYDKALRADRTYLKFKKRLDANPEQCFRYWYGGEPLLAREDGRVQENCGLCGASRQYEMQLMPPLLYFLQEAAKDRQKALLDNWDWMTLLVYTCSKNCWSPVNVEAEAVTTGDWTVAEEAVPVQYEKPVSLDQVTSYFS